MAKDKKTSRAAAFVGHASIKSKTSCRMHVISSLGMSAPTTKQQFSQKETPQPPPPLQKKPMKKKIRGERGNIQKLGSKTADYLFNGNLHQHRLKKRKKETAQ